MPSIADAGEGAAGALGGDPAVQALRLGEDPAELVGGEPRDELAVADRGGEPAPDFGEHAVAREPAVLGVDALEAVDVDEDEGERALVALRAAGLGAELLVEGAAVGKVRERVAGRQRAELGARVGEGDRGLGSDRELAASRTAAPFSATSAPQRRAPIRIGAAPGAAWPVRKTSAAGPSSVERHGRSGHQSVASPSGSHAPRIVPKPLVSKRTTEAAATPRSCATSSATTVKSSTGSGSTAIASCSRCSAVRPAVATAVKHGDEADHEAVLVAAREPAALEHDVAPVLVRIALGPVRRRGEVVEVQEPVGLGADQLPRLIAEHRERGGGAGADEAVTVELEDERVARVSDELLRALRLAHLGRGAAQPQRGDDEEEHEREPRAGDAERGDRGGRRGGERDTPDAAADVRLRDA